MIWVAVALVFIGGAGWWLIHVTEGAYLGPRIVRLLYDLTADGYDDLKDFDRVEEYMFLGLPLILKLEDTVGPAPEILDVATGTGRLPLALLELDEFQGRIEAIDSSGRMLEIAQRKIEALGERADWVTLRRASALPLDYADERFDAVTSMEALEFLPSVEKALREMYRVLRPGGLLLVTRRTGWESKLFPGRVWPAEAFEARMARIGFEQIETGPWQSYYDIVWAQKPAADGQVASPTRADHPLDD